MANSSQILDLAGSIVLVVKQDGTILYLNQYGLEFFGYTKDELVGKHVVGSLTPATDSDGADLEGLIEIILQNPDKHATNENENIRKDGSRVWVAWSNRLTKVDDLGGNVIICVGNDVTERRRLEVQVGDQQRLAARSDRLRSLGEMASGMAHEFNQPLSIIRGAAENILIGKERDWPIRSIGDFDLKTGGVET